MARKPQGFWPRVHPQPTPEGCWVWLGARGTGGYGALWDSGRRYYAHRWLFERVYGVIPPDLELDHLCRNRQCVNPIHLEMVSHLTNCQRGIQRGHKITHCPKGHEYTLENTYIPKSKACRMCRQCHTERERQRRKTIALNIR